MPLRRWLAILLVVVMVLPMTLQVNAGGPSNVSDVVPDRALRALINAKLSTEENPRQATDPISKEDMEKLEGEDASKLKQTADLSQGPGMNDPADISKKGLCSDGLEESQKTIQSLEGLQYATNLKSLDLSGNQITDLTPLKDFLERMNQGADYFAWLVAQKAPAWESPVLEADPEGETVPVPDSNFPAIGSWRNWNRKTARKIVRSHLISRP